MSIFTILCQKCRSYIPHTLEICTSCGNKLDLVELIQTEICQWLPEIERLQSELDHVIAEASPLVQKANCRSPSLTAKLLGIGAKIVTPGVLVRGFVGELIDQKVADSILSKAEHQQLKSFDERIRVIQQKLNDANARVRRCRSWLQSRGHSTA